MNNGPNQAPKYFDILEARKAHAEGKNITALLRAQRNSSINTPEIIEVAYDVQAGTYIELANKNREQALRYAKELAGIIDLHVGPEDTLLDIGSGEITTLSLLARSLLVKPRHILAFDISWSRIYKGLGFARENMAGCFDRLVPFVADIGEIPLFDKSVNITTSSHALEPNGGKLLELMTELFRITKDKLILFEPCYEMNSPEGKARMDSLGYIKGMEAIVEKLGGRLIDKVEIGNISNRLNPTVCFVIEPSAARSSNRPATASSIFSVPGTNLGIRQEDSFYISDATGLCFPVLKSIPILKSNAAVLASSLVLD